MTKMVFLIGPRASGKTSLGRVLARRLDVPFLDTDEYVRALSGRTVAELVAGEGWEGFRRRESEALRAASAGVVATGGGAVLSPENRAFMRGSGLALYLAVPVPELVRRLSSAPDGGQRPSLTGKAAADEVAEVMRLREPLYLETAHQVIDAARDIGRLAEEAERLIRSGRATIS